MKNRTLKATLFSLLALSMTLASCGGDRSSSTDNSSTENNNSESNQSTSKTDQESSSQGGGGSDVGGVKSTKDQEGPSDLNIYLAYEGDITNRNYVWLWGQTGSGLDGSLFPVSSDTTVTFEKTGDDVKFIPLYIKFNQEYECWTTWTDDVTSIPTSTFKVTGIDVLKGLLFRDASGDKKDAKGDILIDPNKMQKDENGNYSVFIDDVKGIYYSIESFPVTNVKSAVYKEIVNGDTTTYEVELTAKTGKDLRTEFPSADYLDLSIRPYKYVDGVKKYNRGYYFDTEKSTINESKATLVFKTNSLNQSLDLTYNYELAMRGSIGGNYGTIADLNMLPYYTSKNFETKYYTMEKLGAFVVDNKTVFKVWSPVATSMKLNLYTNATDNNITQYEMTKSEQGVFSVALDGNLNGRYYTFDIDLFGDMNYDVPDPYAYSSNANGERSMVVDFNTVNTEEYRNETNWAPSTSNYAGITIMEMHTRDFTANSSWNGSEVNRGKFKGLYETGTTLQDGTKTGFDYVKEMQQNGLTHVQILPAFDFASVDETKLDDEDYKNAPYGGIYNWGYDPQQYNAPEGSYSSDPNDGTTRVTEFRDFVNSYNEAGVGVVMDVVYNHMPSQTGSVFEKVFPGYYFRSKSSSGAGSDIASQRGMVRRFIVDSVVSWAKNYHVSGFRFDLMGLLDQATMIEVRKALDNIDPDILLYGEGWSMFGGDEDYGNRHLDMATQISIADAGDNWYGAFNDDYRDAATGSNSVTTERGFVQTALGYADGAELNTGKRSKLYYGLSGTYDVHDTGRFTYSDASSDGIGASIAYFECHDNMTLYDRYKISRTSTMTEADIHKEVIMTNDNLMGALSTSFFQIGQDFGKSKVITDEKYLVSGKYFEDPYETGVYYSHDSYNLSDDINSIDWNLLVTNSDIETAFRTAMNRRKEVSKEFSTYSCSDFWDYQKGNYKTNLAINDQSNGNNWVLSYSLNLQNGKTYYWGQNFSYSDVTLAADITIPAYGSIAVVK